MYTRQMRNGTRSNVLLSFAKQIVKFPLYIGHILFVEPDIDTFRPLKKLFNRLLLVFIFTK